MANIRDNTSNNYDLISNIEFTREKIESFLYENRITPFGINSINEDDRFGEKLCHYQDILVIGSKYHGYDANGDNFISNSGSIWIYELNVNDWQPVSRITSSFRHENEYFSESIDIFNKTIIIGSPGHSFDINNENEIINSGALFLVEKDITWNISTKFTPTGLNSRNANDRFGASCSISGNYFVVGSPGHSYDESGTTQVDKSGAIWIFTKDTIWQQIQKIVPTGTNNRNINDEFGYNVFIKNDWLFVSSKNDYDTNGNNQIINAGKVFVFKYNQSTNIWEQTQTIVSNSRIENGLYGSNIFMDENRLLISDIKNNSVDIYGLSSQWNLIETKSITDYKSEPLSLIHFFGDNGSNQFIDEIDSGNSGIQTNLTLVANNGSGFDNTNTINGIGSLKVNAGDYALIQPVNNNFLIGTNDFCLESWIYISGPISSAQVLLIYGGETPTYINSNFGFYVTVLSDSRIQLVFKGDGSVQTTYNSTDTVSLNSWFKLSILRNNGSLNLMINDETYISSYNTGNINVTLEPIKLGYESFNTASISFADLRLTLNQYRYTENTSSWVDQDFPSGNPINAPYLMRFENNNTNEGTRTTTVSVIGSGVTYSTSIKKYGTYSVYFNGSGRIDYNYLSASGRSFSYEGYFYPQFTGTSSYNMFGLRRGGTEYFSLVYNMNLKQFEIFYSPSSSFSTTIPYDLPSNQWSHIYIETYNPSFIKLFINGILIGNISTGISSVNTVPNLILTLGHTVKSGTVNYIGYIDNFRATQTEIYAMASSNIILDQPLPESSDILWNDVSFLYHLTENIDEKLNIPVVITEFTGNSVITNNEGIFNKQSIEIDKETFEISFSDKFDISSNDFSIEFWVKFDDEMYDTTTGINPVRSSTTSLSSGGFFKYNGICEIRTFGEQNSRISSRSMRLEFRDNTGITRYYTISNNDWFHVGIVRNNDTLKYFINGDLIFSNNLTENYTFTTDNTVNFAYDDYNQNVNKERIHCYINEFIIHSPSRYYSNFNLATSFLTLDTTDTFGSGLYYFNDSYFISNVSSNGGNISNKLNSLQFKKPITNTILNNSGVVYSDTAQKSINNNGTIKTNKSGSKFGYKVKINNGNILISAPTDSYDSNNLKYMNESGSVYLYQIQNNKIQFIEKLSDTSRRPMSNFGQHIDIVDNTFLITSPEWRYSHHYSYRTRYRVPSDAGNFNYYSSNNTDFYFDYAKNSIYELTNNAIILSNETIGETITSNESIVSEPGILDYPDYPTTWPTYTGNIDNNNKYGYSAKLLTVDNYVIGSYQKSFSLPQYKEISNVGSVLIYGNTDYELTSMGADIFRHAQGKFGYAADTYENMIAISEIGDITNKLGLTQGTGTGYGSVHVFQYDSNFILYDKVISNSPTSNGNFGFDISIKDNILSVVSNVDTVTKNEVFSNNTNFEYKIMTTQSGYSSNVLSDNKVVSGNPFYDNIPNDLTDVGTANILYKKPKDISSIGNISFEEGKFNNAILLDNSYLYLKNSSDLYFSGNIDFCIEMWIKTSNPIGTLIKTNSLWIGLGTSNTTADNGRIGIWYQSTKVITGSVRVDDNQWHHIAITRNGITVRLFVDGILLGTTTNINVFSSDWYIGTNNTVSGFNYSGLLDELRIYYNVSKYIANFTPPLISQGDIQDPLFDNASVILLFDDNINDSSNKWWNSNPEQKIEPLVILNNRNSGDHFGYKVNLNDVLLAISSPNNSFSEDGTINESNMGAIYSYILDQNSNTWLYDTKLTKSQELLTGNTNVSVFNKTIFSSNGNNLLSWSLLDDGSWLENNSLEVNHTSITIKDEQNILFGNILDNVGIGEQPDIIEAGSIIEYVNNNGWTTYRYTTPGISNGRSANDQFGYSVYVGNNFLAIGSPGYSYDQYGNDRASNSGTVYIFTQPGGEYGSDWRYNNKIVSSQNIEYAIGQRISGKGDYLITSQYQTNNSYFEIFHNNSNEWESLYWTSSNDIALEGYWLSMPTDDKFIVSRPFGDGTITNALNIPESGEVKTFERVGNTITETAGLIIPGSTSNRYQGDKFGSVVVNSNEYLIIGSSYHSYDEQGDNFVQAAGAIFIYHRNGNTYNFIKKITQPQEDRQYYSRFGYSISITNDGSFIAVGAINDNKVYVYEFDGTTTSLMQTIIGDADTNFGCAVGINTQKLVIGASENSYDENNEELLTNSGAVFVYTLINGIWEFTEKQVGFSNSSVTPPYGLTQTNSRNENDRFGETLSLSENSALLVGSQYHSYDQIGDNYVESAGAVWFRYIG